MRRRGGRGKLKERYGSIWGEEEENGERKEMEGNADYGESFHFDMAHHMKIEKGFNESQMAHQMKRGSVGIWA